MKYLEIGKNIMARYSINKYKILSLLIFLGSYFIERYRLPKKCIIELVIHIDNFPPITSNIDNNRKYGFLL